MGHVKKRTEFSTTTKGIDSNTISAGEDNLIIILSALLSLKLYFENIDPFRVVESILLIDELDATLHPAYQIKLLDLFKNYSNKYRIQFFFTTHSLSLIEECLKRKECHVEYLIDNITNVIQMPSPDIYKIKLHLRNQIKREIYDDVTIPVFTEDGEARVFLEILFEEIASRDVNFSKIKSLFHFVDASIGAENLRAIFTDSKILRTTIRSICVLDGDQKYDIQNQIITLPGSESPEVLSFKYLRTLVGLEDNFWSDDYLISNGYSKTKCNSDIVSIMDKIDKEYQEMKSQGKTTRGFRREKNKELFNKYLDLFKIILKYWIKNNNSELADFADRLHTMFIKVSDCHEINPSDWQSVSTSIRDIKKGENGEQFLF
jgi:AAA15 family ATPase/GTPase